MTDPAPYFTDVRINGLATLQLPDFRAVRYLAAGERGWERERVASMHLNLCDSDTLLDVGSETGDMTALFATWVRDVLMMEPNPLVWANAKAIFEANALAPPLAHWVGFASTETADAPTPTVTEPYGTGWPACAKGPLVAAHGFRHLAEETDVTPQITIDDFTARAPRRPTAVTMDIEGAELQALRGAERLLTYDRPLLWVSVHPRFLGDWFGQRPADVYRFLEEHDYRVTHLADDHETHVMAEPR